MQATLSQENHTRSSLVSLGQNHGYRFEGDTAILNAELAIEPHAEDGLSELGERWALQLWACDTPHQGGPLRGIKVAEAALALSQRDRDYLETAAFTQLPPAQRAYSMVLVLASGTAGAYDQVHDFSNYPARQQFAAPHLEGSVGYRFEGDSLVLQAEGIRNPRDADNLSGSLSLQLWALREPYVGGAFEGVLLGSAELDRLAGQSEEQAIERRVSLRQAPEGEWRLALMLREWTESAGYITRDFCNFASSHHVESTHGVETGAVQSCQADAESVAFRDNRDDADPALAGAALQHDAHAELRAREEEAARAELRAHEEEAARAELRAREEEAARAELRAREEEAARAELRAREEEAARAELRAREETAVREAEGKARDEATERAAAKVRADEAARAEKAAREAELAERAIVAAREASARIEAAARAESAAKASKAAAPAARASGAAASKPATVTSIAGARVEQPRASTGSATAAARRAASQGSAAQANGARVSIQTASVDELASVAGLNKKLAAAIVRARPFASLDDLRQVRGIGDKMLQQLRASLTL